MTRSASLWRSCAKSCIRHCVLACVLTITAVPPALASNFEIAPVVLELSSARTAGVVKIVNNDNHNVSLQVRAYEWNQVDSKDELQPTQNLIISPPVFNLAPGASQVIRVVSRQAAGASEIAFRLLIDEIPSSSEGALISFKFRISMPVFIAANTAPKLQLDYQLHAGKPARLMVQNSGNRRARLLDLALTLPNGKKINAPAGGNPYTLAGLTRQYLIETETPLAAGSKVKLTANSDAGPIDTELTVAP
ncbi:fimbrial biogenesis chaperone [Herbaspirillum seropedicae]|uniref:fimbrial biogenesis chaperone n=1 Tax=Herbaspirillum seropedicae TaxID=964 RepID=UPI002859548B|nr:fimbria/pilus periplasmic chaperone [Herbaspirillum seropedicae]MDR6394043.1 fimbrial chaperone protein [Herbaspirillum seropedicae]